MYKTPPNVTAVPTPSAAPLMFLLGQREHARLVVPNIKKAEV